MVLNWGTLQTYFQYLNGFKHQEHYIKQIYFIHRRMGWPYGAVANDLDCNIVESEFEPQSHYYISFRANK